MTVDSSLFREALGRFASGVCVVTTVGPGSRPAGVTISSFASLSLDPPLVLFCIGKCSANITTWLGVDHFSINILGEDQEAISETFAAQREDKFAGIAGDLGQNGCFHIAGALVTLECRRTEIHDAGDHHIMIGLVERAEVGSDALPLLRFRATYRQLAG